MLNSLWTTCRTCLCAGALLAFVGCQQLNPKLTYLGDADLNYYRAHAQEIDFPAIVTPTPDEVAGSLPPRTIRDEGPTEIREMPLMEAITLALQNSEIILSLDVDRAGNFVGNDNLYTERITSIYEPAIQESGVLFGGRGVEAALAEFDAQLNASLVWNRDSRITGLTFPGAFSSDTGSFDSSLQKIFAHGGLLELNHSVQYGEPGTVFGDDYTGRFGLQYQQPLLAGAGTEYTRTAGSIVRSFGGITGVSQGVLIARINNDLTLTGVQAEVRNLLSDVEQAYWYLNCSYRLYDIAVDNRNASLETWQLASRRAGEVVIPADEAQARADYYRFRAATEAARSRIYQHERALRRLTGLPINDGSIIRPADELVTAEVVPDWHVCLSEALTHRVELRQQKWRIKSLELQLQAARSLTRPRLDFVGGYQVNGFGNELFDYNSQIPYQSFYESVTAGNQTGWAAGLQFNLPVGLRQAHAQVRNYELRMTKAQSQLAAQEVLVAHELAVAFQELHRHYQTMQTNYQRLLAAEDDIRGREPRYRLGEVLVDEMSRAIQRRAEAEADFLDSACLYNLALVQLQFRKGTLLEYNSVHLVEGPWTAEAQYDLRRHTDARAHARPARHLQSEPTDFASDAPVGHVTFTTEAAARLSDQYQPVPDDPPPAPPAPPAESSDDDLEIPDAGDVNLRGIPTVVPVDWVEPPQLEPATARLPGLEAATLGSEFRVRAGESEYGQTIPTPATTVPQSRVRLRRGDLYDSNILSPEQNP